MRSASHDYRILFGLIIFILLSATRPGFSHQNDFATAAQGQKHEHLVGSDDPNLVPVLNEKDVPVVDGTAEVQEVDPVILNKKLQAIGKNVGLTEAEVNRVARAIGLDVDKSASLNVDGGIGVGGQNPIHQTGQLGLGQLFAAKRFCGFSPKISSSRLSNVAPGQFPWSVAILTSDKKFLCSGTLVSESIVVTTASCIVRYRSNSNQPLLVILGAWSLPDAYEYNMPELELFVSAAVLNPGYNQNNNVHTQGNTQNNIALLRLVENVDFDLYPHIFPICLISTSLEQHAGTNQCQVLGWPDLPEIQTWRTRAYLASGDVQVIKQGCASHPEAGPCSQGHCCVGNEGSTVQCLTNSNRYYQWGMIANEPNCDRGASVSVAIVNLMDHYDFISEYLWTPNPNPQAPRDSLSPIVVNSNILPNGQANVIRVPAGGAAVVQGVDNPNIVRA